MSGRPRPTEAEAHLGAAGGLIGEATAQAPAAWRAHRGPAGFALALALMLAWGLHLGCWLALPWGAAPAWAFAMGALGQTWLYTALFITAHEAMHGLIWPGRPWVNLGVGRAAVALYALFGYAQLLREHHRHHAHPASAEDPDFHAEGRPGFWRWYLRFFGHYGAWWQVVGMGLAFNLLHHLGGVPQAKLWLFWAGPALLSSLQLFYFGTYRPHRSPPGGHAEPHRARSDAFPVWLSLLSCLHFGYHLEHHRFPQVAWWRLPTARRLALAAPGEGQSQEV